ncbi:unnamed protein product [Diamesa serratosioi]
METAGATDETWEVIAKESLTQYYNRGGHGLGDLHQLLEGSNFINTIGYSLSLVPNISYDKWSNEHLQLARDGNIGYYEGKNLEAIEHITTKIMAECKGSKEVFLTILPISFFYSGSLITLPLFRYKIEVEGKIEQFMDHTGRVYVDFEDWLKNNTLPAVKLLYPRDGKLVKLAKDVEFQVDCVLADSAEMQRPVKTLLACDIASGALGIIAGIGATVLTGGLALAALGAVGATATYGVGRTGLRLHDRIAHKESVNPFNNLEAFWLWLGLGADVVTFGTIGAASAKFLTTISTGSSFVDISKKFASATRALSIFSKSARPIGDGAKVLMTGYEIFSKIRSKNCSITKLPKASLMVITDSIEEFDESNMLMMAVTEGYWSKSKMKYCSPEEFGEILQETIIAHMAEQCVDPGMFEDLRLQVQNDQSLIEVYKHLDENMDLNDIIIVLNDIYSANDDKMEAKIYPQECAIKLGNFMLNLNTMGQLTTEERFKIVSFLRKLDPNQETRFLAIQDCIGSSIELFQMLRGDNAIELLDVWYDVFTICFDEHLGTVNAYGNSVQLRNHIIPIDLLKKFTKEERMNIIFSLKNFSDIESNNFKKLCELMDQETCFKILAANNEEKAKLLNNLADKK